MAQINLKETVTPLTPSLGRVGIYIDTAGDPYIIDDAGVSSPLGGSTLSSDILDALNGADTPSVSNVFATMADITVGTGTVTSVAISGTDGIEVDSGSPITTNGTITLGLNATTIKSTAYPEAVERANNTVLFDQDYIIGNGGARTGAILFSFTSAKRGATTEMCHDGASVTFPTEAMLMFDVADISTTVDNYFMFVITNITASSEVVRVYHALEGGTT